MESILAPAVHFIVLYLIVVSVYIFVFRGIIGGISKEIKQADEAIQEMKHSLNRISAIIEDIERGYRDGRRDNGGREEKNNGCN